ncbi:MAG: hypothetical protein QF362_04830 [Candidatus Woesearchaeota archaeon]|jgi:hypothetical protein|nr:hypothetical protein [Candidatus Woesearchaeota archaeon]MDP7506736.1 hypothetical protein [Candidatus Woesearchaeota archaeon]MDP7610485.1 hypothetical protein [Candidatus Woesearchaeota archaeon]|tara:strand:- start:2321 stop:2488 length:168 start_codon:yes stop_codon:yes gene_type:complete
MKPVKYSEMLKNNKLTKFRPVKDIVVDNTTSGGYKEEQELKNKDEKSRQILLDKF